MAKSKETKEENKVFNVEEYLEKQNFPPPHNDYLKQVYIDFLDEEMSKEQKSSIDEYKEKIIHLF